MRRRSAAAAPRADDTSIFNALPKAKQELIVKLGFYLLAFFLILYHTLRVLIFLILGTPALDDLVLWMLGVTANTSTTRRVATQKRSPHKVSFAKVRFENFVSKFKKLVSKSKVNLSQKK